MKRARLAALTLLLATPLGCGWEGFTGIVPLTFFDNFYAIAAGQAYRSAQLDGETLRIILRDYEIRTVVNLRGEHEDEGWYRREKAACDELGVTLVDIRMSASTLPPRDTLLLLYDTFLTAEHPILIHCQAGADRTGAASAIWRMVVGGNERAAAAEELSPCYGHFEAVHPEMDELVRIFKPDREWIENEYPAP